MDQNRLMLLGTKGGPAVRPGGPMPTSSLLWIKGRPMVVDCGLGVTRSAVDGGLDLRQLQLIFITHLHSDHVLELGGLVHTAWTTGLKQRLRIFGPPGIRALWDGFMLMMVYDCDIRVHDEGRTPLSQLVEVIEYRPGVILDEGDFLVSALRVEHPPLTDCFALRFDAGLSVVFSGDTRFFPPLADFARGADVLVHEALLPAGVDALVARSNGGEKLRQHINASHSTAAEAGLIATRAGVGRLVLHHLVPADDPDFRATDWEAAVRESWAGPVDIGTDGMVIQLPSG